MRGKATQAQNVGAAWVGFQDPVNVRANNQLPNLPVVVLEFLPRVTIRLHLELAALVLVHIQTEIYVHTHNLAETYTYIRVNGGVRSGNRPSNLLYHAERGQVLHEQNHAHGVCGLPSGEVTVVHHSCVRP